MSTKGPSPSALEQRRRVLIALDRELYDYVAAFEQRKAYVHAGDLACGAVDGHGAANRVWARAGALKITLEKMVDGA